QRHPAKWPSATGLALTAPRRGLANQAQDAVTSPDESSRYLWSWVLVQDLRRICSSLLTRPPSASDEARLARSAERVITIEGTERSRWPEYAHGRGLFQERALLILSRSVY